jgi:2,3-bisphosphoglycerate-dependent phosphoglycerate mutase
MSVSQTELIAVRHGETVWNAENRMQGHADISLSNRGLRQAHAVAAALATERLNAVYSSDLQRAFHTAEVINEHHRHRINADVRLREIHLGTFEGLTRDEALTRFGEAYEKFFFSDGTFALPSGETRRQLQQRVDEFLQEIVGRHPGERILIVTHGGVLIGLLRHALAIPVEVSFRAKLYNAAINRFYYENGKWFLGQWGDRHHLSGLETVGVI